MMRVIICEDDSQYAKTIAGHVHAWMGARNHADVETLYFHSSEDLLEAWQNGLHAHMFLLDIQIPNEYSGLHVAQEIRKSNFDVPIVFITHFDDYVYDGYEVDALRYLKKPVDPKALCGCLDVAYRHYAELHRETSVLSLRHYELALRYSELLYIEAKSPDLFVYMLGFKEPHIIQRFRLFQIKNMLPDTLFVHCHRSYIVNIAQIRIVSKNSLTLCNGVDLPVSETHAESLRAHFYRYHEEGQEAL